MRKLLCLLLAASMPVNPATAADAEMESLRRELRELRQRTEQLEKRLQEYEQAPRPQNPPAAEPEAGRAIDAPAAPKSAVEPTRRWSPSDPIRILGRDRNYLDLSFDGLFTAGTSTAEDVEALQPGAHDPKQRGFTVQNLETTFQGMVDPYLRAQASLVFQIDSGGESSFEVEEAYMESLSLPGNLQLRGGQFFTEFGRINPTHPHRWDFVDQPLVNSRMFGGDGLRNPGGRLSWLMPTPFYSELFFTVQNSHGETAHSFRNENEGEPLFGRPQAVERLKTFTDLLLVPRYAVSFDVTDTQTLLLGTSAAFGPNSSGDSSRTEIYGVDLLWKWKPANHAGGFPFVTWQIEAMLRRYKAGSFAEDLDGNGAIDPGEPDLNGDGIADVLPHERLTDYGFYTQLVYGFRKGWTTGVRYDYVDRRREAAYEAVYGLDPARDRRWRVAPNLTWYPSEFSKIRLQYNLDDRERIGFDHSIWLQFEFLLGAHAAHKF